MENTDNVKKARQGQTTKSTQSQSTSLKFSKGQTNNNKITLDVSNLTSHNARHSIKPIQPTSGSMGASLSIDYVYSESDFSLDLNKLASSHPQEQHAKERSIDLNKVKGSSTPFGETNNTSYSSPRISRISWEGDSRNLRDDKIKSPKSNDSRKQSSLPKEKSHASSTEKDHTKNLQSTSNVARQSSSDLNSLLGSRLITSDRTSVWMESDKSTGRRTMSNDTMLDFLLTDDQQREKDAKPPARTSEKNSKSDAAVPQKTGDIQNSGTTELVMDDKGDPVDPTGPQTRDAIAISSFPLWVEPSKPAQLVESNEFAVMSKKHQISSDKGQVENLVMESSNKTKSSLLQENIQFSNLSAVLGEDRLKRLLLNFQESDEYSDVQSEAYNSIGNSMSKKRTALDEVNIWASLDTEDGSLAERNRISDQSNPIWNVSVSKPQSSVNSSNVMSASNGKPVAHVYPERYHSNVANSNVASDMQQSNQEILTKSITLGEKSQKHSYDVTSCLNNHPSLTLAEMNEFVKIDDKESESIVDELGLLTHRPYESPREIVLPYHHSRQIHSKGNLESNNKDSNSNSPGTLKESGTVKYCFSVDEIYAQAKSLQQPNAGVLTETEKQLIVTENTEEKSQHLVSRKDVKLSVVAPEKENNIVDKSSKTISPSPHTRISVLNKQDIAKRNSKEEAHVRPPIYKKESGERKLAWSAESGDGMAGMMEIVAKKQSHDSRTGKGNRI